VTLAPPDWLPSAAAHEAQRLLSVESVDAALVIRLATDGRMRSVWREVTRHNKQGHTRLGMSEAWKDFRPPLNEQFTDHEAAVALFFWCACFLPISGLQSAQLPNGIRCSQPAETKQNDYAHPLKCCESCA